MFDTPGEKTRRNGGLCARPHAVQLDLRWLLLVFFTFAKLQCNRAISLFLFAQNTILHGCLLDDQTICRMHNFVALWSAEIAFQKRADVCYFHALLLILALLARPAQPVLVAECERQQDRHRHENIHFSPATGAAVAQLPVSQCKVAGTRGESREGVLQQSREAPDDEHGSGQGAEVLEAHGGRDVREEEGEEEGAEAGVQHERRHQSGLRAHHQERSPACTQRSCDHGSGCESQAVHHAAHHRDRHHPAGHDQREQTRVAVLLSGPQEPAVAEALVEGPDVEVGPEGEQREEERQRNKLDRQRLRNTCHDGMSCK